MINFLLKPLHTSLISLLIIRLYSIELWGSFVVFIVGIELLTTVINWGQKPYLLRSFSLHPNEIQKNWSAAIFARIPLVLLAFLLLVILPAYRSYVLPLTLWVIFKSINFFFEANIQFHRKYMWSIVAEITSITATVSLVFIHSQSLTIEELIYIFSIASLVKLIIFIPLMKTWRIPELSFSFIKKELTLSFPFFALSIAGLFQTKGDLYVVTYLLSGEELASYQVIISFLLIGQTFSWIVLGPFQKNIYRWKGDNIDQLKKLYLKIGLLASIVASAGLYVVLQYIYQISISLWLTPLFFLYLFSLYTYLIETQLLLKHKKEKKLLLFNIWAALANLTLSLILVRPLGIYGALLSGIVCRAILSGLVIRQTIKIQDVSSS